MLFVLKVSIDGISPKVWRRIVVPDTCTFEQLHYAIQDVIGWDGTHLYKFYKLEGRMDEIVFGKKKLISSILSTSKDDVRYEYDFGDSWDHIVVLEQIVEESNFTQKYYPICLEGKNAAPWDDIGGCWGYENFKKIMQNKEHEEYEEMNQLWHDSIPGVKDDDIFDPTEFDKTRVYFQNLWNDGKYRKNAPRWIHNDAPEPLRRSLGSARKRGVSNT